METYIRAIFASADKYTTELISKKFYIVRHGETDFNRQGMVQGQGIDAPLNERGYQQADAFYSAYKHLDFDKVYTSELIRTVQSVEKFIDLKIPHKVLPGLNEISWGDQEGKKFTDNTSKVYYETLAKWRAGQLDIGIAGGESPEDVMKRQKEAFDHILSQQSESCILICMHGRAMRILLAWLLNYSLSEMDLFEHQNLCLYELTYTGSMFRIDRFNEVSHLEGLNLKD